MREKLQAVIEKLAGVESALAAAALEAQRTEQDAECLELLSSGVKVMRQLRESFAHLAEVIELVRK